MQEHQIRSALSYIDSNDRQTWIKMGASLKSELGERGFALWDEWSQSSPKYNPKHAKQAWKSLREGRVNIGTLFYEAKQRGFIPAKNPTPLSREEILKRQQENRQLRELQANQEAQLKKTAIDLANERWQSAEPADSQHPYLVKKGINDPDIAKTFRQEGDNLLIPLKQFGKVVGVQTITPDGDKQFNKHATVSGSSLMLGSWDNAKKSKEIILCEGLATGASIHLATGKTVVVCFTGNNLDDVAKKLAQQDLTVVIAGDVDRSGMGSKYAYQAKEMLPNAEVVFPEFTPEELEQERPPSDFNDLAQLRGNDSLKKSFDDAFEQLKQEQQQERQAKENQLLTESYIQKMLAQSQQPTHAQVESSVTVDKEEFATKTEIGSQSTIATEALIQADDIRGLNTLKPLHFKVAMATIGVANQVMAKLDHDLKKDMKRNFIENLNKAINGDTLNMPKSIESFIEKQQREQIQERERGELLKTVDLVI